MNKIREAILAVKDEKQVLGMLIAYEPEMQQLKAQVEEINE